MNMTVEQANQYYEYFSNKNWKLDSNDTDWIDVLIKAAILAKDHWCAFTAREYSFCVAVKEKYEALGYEVYISEW